jgi:hypothetical protein
MEESTRAWKLTRGRGYEASVVTHVEELMVRKSFLHARVTDSKLDHLSVEINVTDLEIDANGGCVVRVERVVGELEQRRTLPKSWKSHEATIVLQIRRWSLFLARPSKTIFNHDSLLSCAVHFRAELKAREYRRCSQTYSVGQKQPLIRKIILLSNFTANLRWFNRTKGPHTRSSLTGWKLASSDG